MEKEQIKKLIEDEVKKQVDDEIKKQMESLLGRTVLQIRQYFLKNIK